MSSPSQPVTTFLNVDLDIQGQSGLDDLVDAFGEEVIVLNRTDSVLVIELVKEASSLEDSVSNAIELVRSLPPEAQTIWTLRCHVS